MQAIGIDIGTTSVCGVAIDSVSGNVLKAVTKNSNAFIDTENAWEKIQSVDIIMSVAIGILEELVCEETAVIGVTGQMHGIVYTDKSGKAISPLYTWQDERGNLPYRNTTYAKYLNSFSGYGNVTDFYNRENGIRPENAESYCTIHDYFIMQICGLEKPLMHSSDAASFGCYDLEENKFNYDCNVDLTADYRIAGEYRGIPVSVAIGDNQASVFSTLADNDNILLNIGTGSQVSIISDFPVVAENIETRPYFEGKYLVVGSALCGGRAYSMLKNFYYEILGYATDVNDDEVYVIMNKMLEKVKNTTLIVDTRFAGTRRNPELCGSISGITTENLNPSQLTLGVLKGMATELYKMYEKMNSEKSGIVGSGNGIRKNPNLVNIFEEMFKAEMKVPNHLEEAAFGAALFGLISCGIFKDANEAQKLIKYC